jgi:hypothetical protein
VMPKKTNAETRKIMTNFFNETFILLWFFI